MGRSSGQTTSLGREMYSALPLFITDLFFMTAHQDINAQGAEC